MRNGISNEARVESEIEKKFPVPYAGQKNAESLILSLHRSAPPGRFHSIVLWRTILTEHGFHFSEHGWLNPA